MRFKRHASYHDPTIHKKISEYHIYIYDINILYIAPLFREFQGHSSLTAVFLLNKSRSNEGQGERSKEGCEKSQGLATETKHGCQQSRKAGRLIRKKVETVFSCKER